jgi:hypothetical protein
VTKTVFGWMEFARRPGTIGIHPTPGGVYAQSADLSLAFSDGRRGPFEAQPRWAAVDHPGEPVVGLAHTNTRRQAIRYTFARSLISGSIADAIANSLTTNWHDRLNGVHVGHRPPI